MTHRLAEWERGVGDSLPHVGDGLAAWERNVQDAVPNAVDGLIAWEHSVQDSLPNVGDGLAAMERKVEHSLETAENALGDLEEQIVDGSVPWAIVGEALVLVVLLFALLWLGCCRWCAITVSELRWRAHRRTGRLGQIATKQMKAALDRSAERQADYRPVWARQWRAVRVKGLVTDASVGRFHSALSQELRQKHFPTLLRIYMHYATVRRDAEGKQSGASASALPGRAQERLPADGAPSSWLYVGMSLDGWLSFLRAAQLLNAAPAKGQKRGAGGDTASREAAARRTFLGVHARRSALIDAVATRLVHGARSSSEAERAAGSATDLTLCEFLEAFVLFAVECSAQSLPLAVDAAVAATVERVEKSVTPFASKLGEPPTHAPTGHRRFPLQAPPQVARACCIRYHVCTLLPRQV